MRALCRASGWTLIAGVRYSTRTAFDPPPAGSPFPVAQISVIAGQFARRLLVIASGLIGFPGNWKLNSEGTKYDCGWAPRPETCYFRHRGTAATRFLIATRPYHHQRTTMIVIGLTHSHCCMVVGGTQVPEGLSQEGLSGAAARYRTRDQVPPSRLHRGRGLRIVQRREQTPASKARSRPTICRRRVARQLC